MVASVEGVLMMGAPGTGKGTQAVRIAERRGMAHISTGDMLRGAMQAGTELGRRVRAVVERGDLVSDEIVLQLVQERLQQPDTQDGFLLDGFPRTVAQAEGLEGVMRELGRSLDLVVVLDVPDEAIVERLLARGREDDTEATVRHRLEVYRSQTEPVLAHFEGRVPIAHVDGMGTIEEITERIDGVLGAADRVEES